MCDDATVGSLPATLEAALYTACLESPSPTVDIERLCAAHPAHAPALRQLATEVRGAQRSLHAATAPSSDGLAAGTRFGPYTIEREIGRGAFGRVYKALQATPVRRHVAIKVLSATASAAEVLRRFDSERQVLAQLDHPGIAHVYHAGTTPGGQPFFAMEYLDGGTLIRHADERQLPIRERIYLFLDLCAAVERAHQRGVVHRDLKPGNVLVVTGAERARVKVIDFGLAKVLQPEHVLVEPSTTEIGRLLGTPEYMSPEQANGQAVDARADVWSLGVILFELLTGALPFPSEALRADGLASVVRTLNEQAAPNASSVVDPAAAVARATGAIELRRGLRGDLDLIIATCLQTERNDRYGSAAALAADLRRYLQHEPLTVRPPRLGYVLRKLARRHRAACAAAATVAVAVIAIVVALVWSAVRVADERDRAEVAREAAEANAYAAVIVAAQAAADAGRSGALRTLLATTDPARRGLEYSLLAALGDGALQQISTGVELFNGSVCVGDAVWMGDLVPGHEDLHVIDFVTGARRQLPKPAGPTLGELVTMAVAPDARCVACGHGDGSLVLRDATTGAIQRVLRAAGPLGWGMAWARSGDAVFATGRAGVMRFDLTTGAATRFAPDHSWGIDTSFDGRQIAIGTVDGEVHVREVESGALLARLAHGDTVNAVRFLPGDQRLLSAGRGTLRIWDLASGRGTATQETGSLTIQAAVLARSGQVVVTTHSDGRLQLWNVDDLRPLGSFCGHATASRSVHELPDGRWLSSSWDGSLRIWPASPADVQTPLVGVLGNPMHAALHPTQPRLFVVTERAATALDCERRTVAWDVPLPGFSRGLALAGDGGTVFVGSQNAVVALDSRDGAVRNRATVAAGEEFCRLATRRDGRQILAVTRTGAVFVVDGETFDVQLCMAGSTDQAWREPRAVCVHDRSSLVSVCTANGIRTIDPEAGRTVWSRPGQYTAAVVDIDPDRLLLGRLLGTIEVVVAATGEVLSTHDLAKPGNVGLGELRLAGDRLLVVDGELRIIARADFRELLVLRGRDYSIGGVVHDPPRDVLVTTGGTFLAPAEVLLWPRAERQRRG